MKTKTVKTNADIFHNRVAATIAEAKEQFEKAKSQFLDSAKENPSWAIERYGFWVSQAERAFRSIKRLELFLAAVGARYETQREAVQACLDEEREVLIRGATDSLSSDAVINGVSLAQRHGVAEAVQSLEYLADHEFIDAYDLCAEAQGLEASYRPERDEFSIPECVRNHVGRRPAIEAANRIVQLTREGRLADAVELSARLSNDERLYDEECRLWFADTYRRLLDRFEAERPANLTLQWIRDRLRDLRDISSVERSGIDAKFFRSSGNEIRLCKTEGDYYEYFGGWNGSIKQLKEAAEHCRQNGGDSVYIGGHWLCGDSFDGDFEPTDCEWGLSLSVDDILCDGRASK